MRRYSHINWALCDQVLVSGCNFLTTVLFARILGVDEFGRFALLWLAMMIVNSVHASLLISPMMNIGPKKDPVQQDGFFSVLLVMEAISIVVSGTVIWCGTLGVDAVLDNLDLNSLAAPLAAAAVAFFAREFFRRYFFARRRSAIAFLNDTLGYAAQFALILAMAGTATFSSTDALWIIAAAAAVSSLAALPRLRLADFRIANLRPVGLECWQFSKWILATASVTTTVQYFYMLIAGALLGTAAVGGLRAAQNLMQATHVLLLAMENVVPVRAAIHLRDNGIPGLKSFLVRTTWTLLLASTVIALVTSLAPTFWLTLVFGEDYREFALVLQIFAIQSLLTAAGFVLRSGLRTLEKTRAIFVSQLFNSSSALALAYPLMAAFGVTGAALGRLPANLLYLYLMWTAFRRALRAQEDEVS
jgi:O-antigen/teichoic acid export membrane protein